MKSLIEKHYWLFLGLIVAFAFATRIYQVGKIQAYIFDEVYHAVTAKLISQNDPRAYEWWNEPPEPNTAVDWLHPPLAKYTQAASMLVFGETPFGWRFSSVIFGTLVILATALLAEELFEDKRISLLAAGLASMDGLLLVQSRIAMNDIHVTFFILLTLFVYLKYRKNPTRIFLLFLTGLCAGLASISKWSGVFALGTVLLFEGIHLLPQVRHLRKNLKDILGQTGKIILLLVILPAFIYVFGYIHMFLQGKSLLCEQDYVQQGTCYCEQTSSWWVDGLKKIAPQNSVQWDALEARGGCKRLISHFSELHKQIWWYQTNLKATHTYQSRPWQWFLDARPVWMFVEYNSNSVANIYAEGNPFLFWAADIAILFTLYFLINRTIRKKKDTPQTWALTFLTVAYFFVWILWEFSPRIMFFYHYTPAVPLLSIILSYWLVKLQNYKGDIRIGKYHIALSRCILAITVFLIAITFIVFYPNWTGISIPSTVAEKLYYFEFLSLWRKVELALTTTDLKM